MKDRPLREVAPDRRPLTLPPETTVQEACARMREARMTAALVTDADGRLRGIFTGRDAICRVLAEARDPAETRLADVMTSHVEALGPADRAMDALHLMHDGGFRHLPILDEGRVVGMVARNDFRALERARMEEEGEYFRVLR